jgi:two-component system chemotaxis response regulator CheY
MRFLVIDDSLPMRRIITNVLSRLGHTDVVVASNGREALKRVETDRVDFIITDWYMPEMSGLDFLRTLRGKEETKDVPIVIVTANGSRDDVAQAIELRVNAYVLKPFTAETLKDRIGAICAAQGPPAGADAAVAAAASPH